MAALCWLYVSQEGLEPGGIRSSVTQIFGQAEENMGSHVLDRLEVASHQNYSGLKLPNLVMRLFVFNQNPKPQGFFEYLNG